jgi:uncharacterized protein DUF3800
MFFVDESGHEEFADPNHPVFVLGGCAIMMAAIDSVVRLPWRELKNSHFGGADKPRFMLAIYAIRPTTSWKHLETFFVSKHLVALL